MAYPDASSWRRIAAIVAISGVLVAACGPSVASPALSGGTMVPSAATAGPSAAQAVACGSPVSPSPTTTGAAPWWRDRVFYEVFVRSFADSNGDGIGDLRGLTQRLDYLNDGDPATTSDLGVTALWLMPVAASPSYHGYDVTDYKAIERDYGTAADFKALVAAAHKRGIAIVVDLVLNHTSDQNPWFQDSRKPGSAHADWYVWSNTDPGISGPGGAEVWHKDGDRWYYGYFSKGMPDLNLRDPAVTAALDDVSKFWLDDLGVDGFRLDAAKYLIEDGATLQNTPETTAWLEGFRSRVKAVKPSALLVGEVWDSTAMSSSYVRAGALDMTFGFDLAAATLGAVRLGDANSLTQVQAEMTADYPSGGYGAFLTNHDQDRTMDVLGDDPASASLAATLLLTGSGVPFIYYGEELGMHGRKPDEQIRTPLAWDTTTPAHGFTTGTPWEDFAPGVDVANVASQTGDPTSLLARYRTLIGLRAANPALQDGRVIPMDKATPGVYAYLRDDGAETVAVVANMTDSAIDDPSLSVQAGPLCGQPTVDVVLGDAAVTAPSVTAAGGFEGYIPVHQLGPKQAVVFRISP